MNSILSGKGALHSIQPLETLW